MSSYLDDVGAAKVIKSGAAGDQVKSRLEQLDDFEDGSMQEMLDLSQQVSTPGWMGARRSRLMISTRTCAWLGHLRLPAHSDNNKSEV